ncbi:Proteophosphoglycan ppg4, related [Eimeria brunetti]|uniref:Proteophosphoglycan ppg4, related n=1 Tax=Eimeria brunetti TaxID=51314 RepID=U6LSU4_9EIME|nr:Proteophosphoglycan ppg4, related [Eimeria brunetti]
MVKAAAKGPRAAPPAPNAAASRSCQLSESSPAAAPEAHPEGATAADEGVIYGLLSKDEAERVVERAGRRAVEGRRKVGTVAPAAFRPRPKAVSAQLPQTSYRSAAAAERVRSDISATGEDDVVNVHLAKEGAERVVEGAGRKSAASVVKATAKGPPAAPPAPTAAGGKAAEGMVKAAAKGPPAAPPAPKAAAAKPAQPSDPSSPAAAPKAHPEGAAAAEEEAVVYGPLTKDEAERLAEHGGEKGADGMVKATAKRPPAAPPAPKAAAAKPAQPSESSSREAAPKAHPEGAAAAEEEAVVYGPLTKDEAERLAKGGRGKGGEVAVKATAKGPPAAPPAPKAAAAKPAQPSDPSSPAAAPAAPKAHPEGAAAAEEEAVVHGPLAKDEAERLLEPSGGEGGAGAAGEFEGTGKEVGRPSAVQFAHGGNFVPAAGVTPVSRTEASRITGEVDAVCGSEKNQAAYRGGRPGGGVATEKTAQCVPEATSARRPSALPPPHAYSKDVRHGEFSRGVDSRDVVDLGTRTSRVQHGESEPCAHAVQDKGSNVQPPMESPKAETLRRLPTRTAGGKTLTLKAVPKRSSSSQSFVQRVGPPVAPWSVVQEDRDRSIPQHAVESPEQHEEPEKPKVDHSSSGAELPALIHGEGKPTPTSEIPVSSLPDYLPAPASIQSDMSEISREQPKSVFIRAAQLTATAEAGPKGQLPAHDPLIPTAKDISEAILIQAHWRGHEVRTWVQAASVVRSMKWDFSAPTTKCTDKIDVKPASSSLLNDVSGGLSQPNAKTARPPIDSRAVREAQRGISPSQIPVPPSTIETHLSGKSDNKTICVQGAQPSNEQPMPTFKSLTAGRIKGLPALRRQSSVTCADGKISHHKIGTGSKQSVPVGPPDAGYSKSPQLGQPRTEPPQTNVPLTTTNGAYGASGTPDAANVAESPLSKGAFPSSTRCADARSQSPVIARPQSVPGGDKDSLARVTRELCTSSPVLESGTIQGEDKLSDKSYSTEAAQVEKEDVLEHSSPGAASNPAVLVGEPGGLGGSLERQHNESDAPRGPKDSQEIEQKKSSHLEGSLASNTACEEVTADDVMPHAPEKKTPEVDNGSVAERRVQSCQALEASSSKESKRHVTCSVPPFVPFVGRPMKAAQHGQVRDTERVEQGPESSEQNTGVESEGAVPGLGRRVSMALRNAYSIFGTVAQVGREQPVQREAGDGVSHAAVGWLRGRSISEIEIQGETATETAEATRQNIQPSSVKKSGGPSTSWSPLAMTSTQPVVKRPSTAQPVDDSFMEESDRQALASETKRWGRRFTTVNIHEPRAVDAGPTLNPFRLAHRTEEFAEKQMQPIQRRK